MKIVIFGASGSLGQHLVKQALNQGHQVSAFARDPSALKLQHQDLTRIKGNALKPIDVAAAVKGHDAVLIVLGTGPMGSIRAIGTKNIVDAMQYCGIRRLVCLSTLGTGDSGALLNFFWKHIMFGMLLRKVFADHQAQEKIVNESDLDWTIVRPAAFTDGPATGTYEHGSSLAGKKLKLKISRADIASFMVQQLSSDSYVHQSPGLSY
ncbi:MAG: NAD(P)H-binding protein [Gammaproteobacteria bacterium]|nr:NAD(P)H-binding protein [Gammaproteobacteria bacterium]